jgi:hypothetical protein
MNHPSTECSPHSPVGKHPHNVADGVIRFDQTECQDCIRCQRICFWDECRCTSRWPDRLAGKWGLLIDAARGDCLHEKRRPLLVHASVVGWPTRRSVAATAKQSESTQRAKKRGGGFGDGDKVESPAGSSNWSGKSAQRITLCDKCDSIGKRCSKKHGADYTNIRREQGVSVGRLKNYPSVARRTDALSGSDKNMDVLASQRCGLYGNHTPIYLRRVQHTQSKLCPGFRSVIVIAGGPVKGSWSSAIDIDHVSLSRPDSLADCDCCGICKPSEKGQHHKDFK